MFEEPVFSASQHVRAGGAQLFSEFVATFGLLSVIWGCARLRSSAVPFAVSMGRHGAMFGIGAGLVLALVYWTMLSVFGAIGAGGWISPVLAAWAPNILFGAAAAFLLLTVRT